MASWSSFKDLATDPITGAAREVKPRLRGWLHAGVTPLALVAGIVLVVLAPTVEGKIGGAVFLAASLLLFGTSGLYHRFYWGPGAEAILRRMDHANIFVFIAATYTPMALTMLEGGSRVLLLSLVWGSALFGLLFRVLWLQAPRWLYTVLYIAMGWAALAWLPQFLTAGGPVVLTLILAGGLLYTLGAVVYARKRPNPSPRWFGFHEIFHAATIGAFGCHYAAISIATYGS
ncbi:hemolysin III family protein [Auraticoccus sp. F435]|uniref:Hemolysin III family protein n=1 Tax=Auraticoccus cholistanensis TaxID=2656650 RepID=A0A6A9UXL1_9ACTN|nr:hemolysin III family protein [Auraticoccus cholistanensis]MVA76314.1 hemolysin III family protein [Auraticoccus cholistanensis]